MDRAFSRQRCAALRGSSRAPARRDAAWSREYGFPEGNIWSYETIHEIADNPDVDMVYVVTPNGLHMEHVLKVAGAGKHVICEKPMANSVADCDTMIAACGKAGVMLSIGYRLQFDPHHIELDRLARERDFGVLTRMSGEHSWKFGPRAWRIEKSLSGGGPLMDVGIYVVHAACRAAMGQPAAVTARELPRRTRSSSTRSRRRSSGRWISREGRAAPRRPATRGAANFFQAQGEKGWIRLEPALRLRAHRGQHLRGHLDIPQVPQQALQMDDFASCILTGRETPVPGSMGRDHMATIEAIYRSAAEGGRRIEVARA